LKSLDVSQSDIDRYFADATFPKPTGRAGSR
jgi:predicted DNA-binding transcriptional regulator AlpA